MRRNFHLLLCAGLLQLANGGDRKASITPSAVLPAIASPVLGYFEFSGDLVAIEGVSSAAHTRLFTKTRIAATRVVLPPRQGYQWLERAGQVSVALIPRGPARLVPNVSPADLMAFNSDGSAAIVYHTGGPLQVVGGLPNAPRVVREIPPPNGTNGVIAIAIGDDLNTLLLASSAGIYAQSGGDGWRFAMTGKANAMAFLPHTSDALVALDDQIYLLKNSTTARFLTADSAKAVAASEDGRTAVALKSGGREALVIDLQSGAATHLQLGAAARDLQRGRDGTLIFIPQKGASPWLLDMKSGVLSFAPELPDIAHGR